MCLYFKSNIIRETNSENEQIQFVHERNNGIVIKRDYKLFICNPYLCNQRHSVTFHSRDSPEVAS